MAEDMKEALLKPLLKKVSLYHENVKVPIMPRNFLARNTLDYGIFRTSNERIEFLFCSAFFLTLKHAEKRHFGLSVLVMDGRKTLGTKSCL
jgi:hypothetical protein